MITFTCNGKGCSPRQWECSLEIQQKGDPCEAELCARGSRFHLIVGRHSYWNKERFRHYRRMKKADACTIVSALKVLAEHGCMN